MINSPFQQSPLSEAAMEASVADDNSSIGAKDEEDDDEDDDGSDDRIDANNCGGDPEKLKAFNVSSTAGKVRRLIHNTLFYRN
jgi:hypothetical protein